jgi:DNA-binding MurR/RpiR family transcriptional regulator
MDILKQIGEHMPHLTAKQQKVAKYILDNWDKVAYQSAIMIAEKLQMSQSSVIRAVNALGFNGVPHMQSELRDFVQTRISTLSRIDRASRTQNKNDIEGLISTILRQSEENLRHTLHSLDPDKLREAVERVKKAKKIYVLGMRSSASLAHFFGFNLNLLLKNVSIIGSDYNLYEKLRTLTDEDVLISFSFSRYTRVALESTRIAKERGCTVIGITDSLSSPLTALSHITFITQTASLHMTNSYTAAMALLDALLSAITLSAKDKYLKELEDLEAGFQRLQIFENF